MTNYEYGFITKCAEYGVDPEILIKVAWSNSDFEDDIEARAAQHAKDLGLNRYDPNNKAGTMVSRGWNKLIKSREGYEDWYINKKNNEMNEHIARTNKINQFGSGFNKVHDVYSAKPGSGATPNASATQTKTLQSGGQAARVAAKHFQQQQRAQGYNSNRPHLGTFVPDHLQSQSSQVHDKYLSLVRGNRGSASNRPHLGTFVPDHLQSQSSQVPQVPNNRPLIVRGHQGGTSWNGIS